MLRHRSLIVLLENHGYIRKSLQGFITDNPEVFQNYKKLCEEHEAYEMLSAMIHGAERIDKEYMIFVKYKELAQIIPIKEMYSRADCAVLVRKTNITEAAIQEMIAGY